MPLFKTKEIGKHTRLLIWKIEESFDELSSGITIHDSEKGKLKALKHPDKAKEFLALRHCLTYHFGENPPVYYTENGKPFLKDGPNISFSHTHGYAAAIISDIFRVGVDIEAHRPSIKRIAPKFLRRDEQMTIIEKNGTGHITAYWGAKEAIVKIEGDRRLNFKQQIRINPFLYGDNIHLQGSLYLKNNLKKDYKLYFEKIEDIYVTYGWECFCK